MSLMFLRVYIKYFCIDRSLASMVLAECQPPWTGSGMVHSAAYRRMSIPAAEAQPSVNRTLLAAL